MDNRNPNNEPIDGSSEYLTPPALIAQPHEHRHVPPLSERLTPGDDVELSAELLSALPWLTIPGSDRLGVAAHGHGRIVGRDDVPETPVLIYLHAERGGKPVVAGWAEMSNVTRVFWRDAGPFADLNRQVLTQWAAESFGSGAGDGAGEWGAVDAGPLPETPAHCPACGDGLVVPTNRSVAGCDCPLRIRKAAAAVAGEVARELGRPDDPPAVWRYKAWEVANQYYCRGGVPLTDAGGGPVRRFARMMRWANDIRTITDPPEDTGAETSAARLAAPWGEAARRLGRFAAGTARSDGTRGETSVDPHALVPEGLTLSTIPCIRPGDVRWLRIPGGRQFGAIIPCVEVPVTPGWTAAEAIAAVSDPDPLRCDGWLVASKGGIPSLVARSKPGHRLRVFPNSPFADLSSARVKKWAKRYRSGKGEYGIVSDPTPPGSAPPFPPPAGWSNRPR